MDLRYVPARDAIRALTSGEVRTSKKIPSKTG